MEGGIYPSIPMSRVSILGLEVAFTGTVTYLHMSPWKSPKCTQSLVHPKPPLKNLLTNLLNFHPPKHPKKENYPVQKVSLPLDKATRYIHCISVCCFSNFQKIHPIFSPKKYQKKHPLGRALIQHHMCSLSFPRARATVQLLTWPTAVLLNPR